MDIFEAEMKGPYIAAVQVAAPGGLTFIAQPTDGTGTLHENWINFFTNPRIVKVMVAVDGDQIAMNNTYWKIYPLLDLTWEAGVFDLQNIFYWPELKESGKLSTLEFEV